MTPNNLDVTLVHNERLRRYAELIVHQGLGVKPGQVVNVTLELAHAPLHQLIAAEAYKAGAKHVSIELLDPEIELLHLRYATKEGLEYIPQHAISRVSEIADSEGCNVRIVSFTSPERYDGIPVDKIALIRQAAMRSKKHFYEVGINQGKCQWCVVGAATPEWALQVFPDLPPVEGTHKLWDILFTMCRVDTPDFKERWHAHSETLQCRAHLLNRMRIKDLHFVGPGTDLHVGLSTLASFTGGSKAAANGNPFTANLPTEEVFTTPDYRMTHGTVRIVRPILINGSVVSELSIRFENGEVAEFSAATGESAFAALIRTDHGSSRLGEIALVGIDSPIYQTGLFLYEILYDENAASHLALGSAYKGRIEGGPTMSKEELFVHGVNESAVHTDLMITNEEVSVTALSYDGSTHQILKDGRFVI